MYKNSLFVNLWVFMVLFLLFSGCTSPLRNEQLEQVAKDWALVVRASQLIPVYPLTEDLQPGDVLLVSTPIEEQAAIYKQKGFLPLDQHLVRMYSKDYVEFYNSRYGITKDIIPPANWQNKTANGNHNWELAPCAAFPSYQFSVRTGSGLNLAIPIRGVPFALGLMNSGSASGTVTIADAHTFGLDNVCMEKLVRGWERKNRTLLRNYEPQNKQYHYLRVICRVYVTGKVNVTVNNDEAQAARVAAGADRPITLMGVEKGSTQENYSTAIERINQFAATQIPGANIKVATATSRLVTLTEEFERPLVIGYVGFDMPILKAGRLGAPISTLAQLTGRRIVAASWSGDNVYRLAALSHMYEALNTISGDEADSVREKLDRLVSVLPDRYPFSLYEYISPTQINSDEEVMIGAKVKVENFQSVVNFLGCAQTTIETLESYLPNAPRETDQERKAVLQLEGELRSARAALSDVGNRLNRESALVEAIDFVFLGN